MATVVVAFPRSQSAMFGVAGVLFMSSTYAPYKQHHTSTSQAGPTVLQEELQLPSIDVVDVLLALWGVGTHCFRSLGRAYGVLRARATTPASKLQYARLGDCF